MIYHITTPAAWEAAQAEGAYRADSLTTQGFIHCSTAQQVAHVGNALFPGEKGLILLHIHSDKLTAPLVYENLDGGDELFPHVYGPIANSAIVDVTSFFPGTEGEFTHHQIRLGIVECNGLETNRLRLRPFRMDDAPAVQRLAGDRRVAKTVSNVPHPYEDGLAEAWIESITADLAKGRSLHLAITLKADRDDPPQPIIGAIGLHPSPQSRAAELGYWLGLPYWNKGYTTEAARAVVAYGFDKLGLHRIYAQHMVHNPASGRIMQKLGMTYEGTLRQAAYRFGAHHDLAVYGLLHDEFRAEP